MTVAEFPPVPPPERPSGRYLKATPSSEIPMVKQEWLIPDMIPLNTLTVFGGEGETGKSTMMVDIASRLSRGLLEGDVREPASTLIFSVEDDWARQMGPRIEAAGGDHTRIFSTTIESYVASSGESRETKAVLPLDLDGMAVLIDEVGAKFVVFDPAMSFMEGDPNDAKAVRNAFDPLATLAQETGIAGMLLAHFNKGGSSVGAKLSGSHAWRDLTRSYWGFAKNKETGQRIFSSDKGNYSKENGQSFEFDIESRRVILADGTEEERGAVANIRATDLTVNDLLARDVDPEPSGREEAVQWMLSFLGREPFEQTRKAVMTHGRAEGFSERTLERAKVEARVGNYLAGFPASGFWTHPIKAGSHTSGATGATGEKEDVSAGQHSYATVAPPTDTWRNSGATDLTRANTPKNTSPASHATTESDPESLPLSGMCDDCGKPRATIWGRQSCSCPNPTATHERESPSEQRETA